MADIENGRCHPERAPFNSPPLVQHGKIILQAHHIGWIVCSALTLISIGVSFWLIDKHLRNYTSKYEQRYIVRILFMVPLYAVVSTASYFFWNHSTPLLLIRDCYESTVLTAFFYLLLLYISPDVNEQKEIFRKNGLSRQNDKERRRRGEPLQKWVMPLGFVRKKPEDGLYFLQLMKWGVLQYCVVRPGTTLAAVILDYVGLYCEDSWSLGWGHIYITLVVSVSVSVAMYCLIQVYMVVKVELKPHSPLLKLFAIKAVVFLTFWQATGLSLLTLFGLVKNTPYMTANNINIGIGALLETFEMALFACLHIRAFSYKPYVTDDTRTYPTPRWRSLGHAMNFKETGREIWHGWVYMLRKSRGHEVDAQARREAVLEDVFGRSRFTIARDANGSTAGKGHGSEKDVSVNVHVEKEVRVDDERLWLGAGDDYVYGIGYQARRQKEPSEGLELQIERELALRGYALRGEESGAYSPIVDAEAMPVPGHQRVQSWWRRIYNRLSQTGAEPELDRTSSRHRKHRTSSRRQSREVLGEVGASRLLADVREDDYNDPPPPSAIRTYRETKSKKPPKRKAPPPMQPPLLSASFGDIPSPLSSPEMRDGSRLIIPQSPPNHDSALHPDSPGHLPPPPLSPSVQSVHVDSFLERAFAGSVGHDSSAEVMSAGPSSSQSHQHRIALGSVPRVSTAVKVLPQTPVIVHPSTTRPMSPLVPVSPPPALPARNPLRAQAVSPQRTPDVQDPFASPRSPPPVASPQRNVPSTWAEDPPRGRRPSHRRDSAQYLPEPEASSPTQYSPSPFSPVQQSPTSSARLHRNSVGYSRGTRRNSGPPPQQPQYTPMNRFTPTRDRIVLPTPLATSSSGSQGNAASPPRQTFSPSRYTPPGLASSPSSTYRRSSAPYSPPYPPTAK
ncbi:transporter [Ganoderma sinense ZZ0214-1]|uniref:Transporter n=1 Tax=Ganoderma sinense ZZ0214-1 TaxID=1077348 RepID=A0A2G8RUK7_9APHY|nr:transporter [Ganoderma sinense ZZ0214-1]